MKFLFFIFSIPLLLPAQPSLATYCLQFPNGIPIIVSCPAGIPGPVGPAGPIGPQGPSGSGINNFIIVPVTSLKPGTLYLPLSDGINGIVIQVAAFASIAIAGKDNLGGIQMAFSTQKDGSAIWNPVSSSTGTASQPTAEIMKLFCTPDSSYLAGSAWTRCK